MVGFSIPQTPKKILLLLGLIIPSWLWGSPYPIISLSRNDRNFQFVQQSLTQFYRWEVGQSELPELAFFYFQVPDSMDLFSIASRFGLSPDSLASINGIQNPQEILPEGLIIPSFPGIFQPEKLTTDLEYFVDQRISQENQLPSIPVVLVRNNSPLNGFFFPGQRYQGQERLVFLRLFFTNPLRSYRITASYGLGPDPFTQRMRYHNGIDMVPTNGQNFVLATASGTIKTIAENSLFGKYVIVEHNSVYSSLYAHLSQITVHLDQTISQGAALGLVGSTGLSTGPHLHFEIHRHGLSVDPRLFLMDLH